MLSVILLAGRRPLVFKRDIYAVWAAIAGLVVGLGLFKSDLALYALLVLTAGSSYFFTCLPMETCLTENSIIKAERGVVSDALPLFISSNSSA